MKGLEKTTFINTVKHLRFGFSFFLLPVYLFALSQANVIHWANALLIFAILHLLVFPSSNGYNSYEDKDESSIGGLKHPPKVSKSLYFTTLVFDLAAVTLSMFISSQVALLILIFILMSRAYSYRKIRIKKYPLPAFLVVFIFQGGFIYLISEMAIGVQSIAQSLDTDTWLCMAISSLFIGSMYPLTQIYQHESDKKDGVTSISYLLGYKGTFIFSGILFAIASILLVYYFADIEFITAIVIFIIVLMPMLFKMGSWFNKVRKDAVHANFDNTMLMNKITSASMNIYFLSLLIINILNKT